MSHIDPASPEFELLPRKEQARIYKTIFGWKIKCLAEEFCVATSTIRKWVDDAYAERQRAAKRASDARARERYQATKADRPDLRNRLTAPRSETPVTCPTCKVVHFPRLSDERKKQRTCIKCQSVWVRNYYARQRGKA